MIQTPLSARTAKFMRWRRERCPSAGFRRAAAGAGGATVQKNHPTVGTIINGALVEREIPATIVNDHHVELVLRDPDFTSAARMAAAVNEKFAELLAALDSTTVQVRMPADWGGSPIDFIAQLEMLEVTPDVPARIVINERTGTIVATARIHISSCAVSHGNVTISIASSQDVSQPSRLQPDRHHRGDHPDRREDQGGQGGDGGRCRNCRPWKRWPRPSIPWASRRAT